MKCIWCKKDNQSPSLEHIIPEVLGCPENFVLAEGVVCKSCNNGLARLDRAVADDLDFSSFLAGVSRKCGRSAAIRSRGNVLGTYGPTGPKLSINMMRRPVVAHDGSVLAAFGGSDRNVNADISHDGQAARVSFSVDIGRSPQFARGIAKIAVSAAAYFLGADAMLSQDFDPIRKFVRKGSGGRKILMMFQDDSYRNEVWPPYRSEDGSYVMIFRLSTIEFCVDMSPDMSMFQKIRTQAFAVKGNVGWTWLPRDN